jgi:hypothetical protein
MAGGRPFLDISTRGGRSMKVCVRVCACVCVCVCACVCV